MASAAPSTDSAPVRFATLVGPARGAPRATAAQTSSLLATVVHELRNPLASVRLSLEMAIGDFATLEPAVLLDLLERAQRSACWLELLTDNLSNAACLESGRLNVQPAVTDVVECVESAALFVRGLLEQRGQRVRITSSAPAGQAFADPVRVVQIVANLLANASRHGVDGDTIEVHVSHGEHHLRVRVSDHGPGIPPEEQRRIFGRWRRGRRAGRGGLGLGLSIVRGLVQDQGGRVGVESTVGHGATFWFTLPRVATDEALSPRLAGPTGVPILNGEAACGR